MEYETKKLLQENLELSRKNNKLLHKLRRAQVWGRLLTLLWWAVIIGIPITLYYYVVQPYVAEVASSYQEFRDDIGNLPVLDASERFIDFISSFGAEKGEGSKAPLQE